MNFPLILRRNGLRKTVKKCKHLTIKTRKKCKPKIDHPIYQKKCAISGIDISQMLVAGHILPWATNEKERLNPENGICLSSIYDKAFEKGFLGIDENYRILISDELKKNVRKDYYEPFFGRFEGKTMNLPDRFLPNKEFLEIHINNNFK